MVMTAKQEKKLRDDTVTQTLLRVKCHRQVERRPWVQQATFSRLTIIPSRLGRRPLRRQCHQVCIRTWPAHSRWLVQHSFR